MKVTMRLQIGSHLSLIALVLCFSGCSTPEEQAAYRQQRIEKENERKKQLTRLSKKCRDYGFKNDTTEFSQCLQQAEQQETLERSVKLQKRRVQQGEKDPFESMLELENKTREQFNNK